MSVFDAAIIGSGPAGLSAALTLKARGRSVLWLGDRRFSDKVRRAERVNNYPGLPAVTGSELAEAFLRHAEDMGLSITEGVASGVSRYKDGFLVSVGSELYEAKTVLLATGVAQVGLLPGEEEFLGRGVSWCATCDGMLYRGKTIAVISTDERFDPEVRFLANLAGKTYLLPRYKTEVENAELVSEPPAKINGDERVRSLTLRSGREIEVDGVFILRSSVSPERLVPGLETEDGHIRVSRSMETSVPGIFAAGDCTGRPYQYAKASGEGNVAAHAMLELIAKPIRADLNADDN